MKAWPTRPGFRSERWSGSKPAKPPHGAPRSRCSPTPSESSRRSWPGDRMKVFAGSTREFLLLTAAFVLGHAFIAFELVPLLHKALVA